MSSLRGPPCSSLPGASTTNNSVVVLFSEPMDPASITRNFITLVSAGAVPESKSSASLTITPFRRNEHSPLSGVKYTACAENLIAQRAALAAECDEALFLNTSGTLCEGAFSNVFLVQNGIVLQVSANSTIPISLKVGQVSEQIEVQASAALVETRSNGVGQVIDNERVLELPLNGRQVSQLVTLSGAANDFVPTNAGQSLLSNKNYPTAAAFSMHRGTR